MTATSQDSPPVGADTVRPTIAPRTMLNKVPEVTLYFWIIKILCTTVGETAADFLADNLGLGLTVTTFVMSGVPHRLAGSTVPHQAVRAGHLLARGCPDQHCRNSHHRQPHRQLRDLTRPDDYCLQHRPRTHLRRLVPERTNALDPHDRHDKERGVLLARRPLHLCTRDRRRGSGRRTLRRRLPAIGAFVRRPHRCRLCPPPPVRLNAVLAFWIAYILTRPLGASIGDYLSQPQADGGLGFGTTVTSILFLATILAVVVLLTITKKDQTERRT